jgi:hypothetical protein
MKKQIEKKSFFARLVRCTRGETSPLTYVAVAGLTLTVVATTLAIAKSAGSSAAHEMGDRLGAAGAGAMQ